MDRSLKFDEIGYWSELKLDIIRKYAAAYSQILTAKKLHHVYIDGFAGAGVHVSRRTRRFVPGSPLNALEVRPPFLEYHFVDIHPKKIASLRQRAGPRENVYTYEGDSNQILVEEVFPRVGYKDYRRGLCILDPYGLHLEWKVIKAAGDLKTIDMFLNFPVVDMNRNALWRNPDKVPPERAARMTAYWGDETWRTIAYATSRDLFGDEHFEKEPNRVVAEAFRRRLREVAGFDKVPEPMPMRNRKNAIVYYLFFASQNSTAAKIASEIFNKYREKGGS
jgi:three-Cys-motif partner protein